MNYGRKNAARRKWELTSRGTVMRRKLSSLTLLIVLLLFVSGLGYVGYQGYRFVEKIIAEAPDINEIDATPSGYMSTVLDADGNVTAQLVGTGSNRVYVTLDEIPVDLQHAFVAIEDERFYDHNGIDLRGIARAVAKGLTTGHLTEGASTITQQLLKNNVFEGWTTEDSSQRIERKLQEQYLAVQLEKKVSKDWIMENYLNTINLGQNTLGVQAASRRYFGKDVSELTLSECAVIAGITQNPSKYNPISHPEDNAARREKGLLNMKEQGNIDENKNQVSGSLSALDIQNESSRKEIENLNKQLEAKKAELDKANDDIENLKIRFSSVEQKTAFIQENIIRINSEIAALESEEADIRQRKESLSSEVEDKNAQIEKLRSDIHKAKNQIEDCNTKITALRKDRDIINASHKTFFDKRE